MIDLTNANALNQELKSSKGNQPKWFIDNKYYKQDYAGYEGLVEYVISNLLKYSNLNEDEFVLYDTTSIKNHSLIRNGCISKNFLNDNESLITLIKLYRNNYNRMLNSDVFHITSVEERFKFLVNSISNLTNIHNFGQYITKIIEIDTFFLNEDRHFNNIALIYSNQEYKLCPIFDNGLSLLSDTTLDYPFSEDMYELMKKVQPKTIAFDFYEQLEAAEKLYGQQMHFSFTKKDIRDILEKEENYSNQEKNRIENLLYEQMRRYSYLFK